MGDCHWRLEEEDHVRKGSWSRLVVCRDDLPALELGHLPRRHPLRRQAWCRFLRQVMRALWSARPDVSGAVSALFRLIEDYAHVRSLEERCGSGVEKNRKPRNVRGFAISHRSDPELEATARLIGR